MHHFIKIIIASTCLASPAWACVTTSTPPDQATAIATLNSDDAAAAQTAARSLAKLMNNDTLEFCGAYSLGRYLTTQKQYSRAQEVLNKAIASAQPSDLTELAPWNVLGFTYLQQQDFEAAMAAFQQQLDVPNFDQLPQATRMKVLNNTGFTALQLGQYDTAMTTLTQASSLGSRLARNNLEKTEAIIATLQAGDATAPGVFTTVLSSLKIESNVEPMLADVSSKLGVPVDDLAVFESKNGFFAITYGAYDSYPLAQTRQGEAIAKGISDAYVTSAAEWTKVTSTFVESAQK